MFRYDRSGQQMPLNWKKSSMSYSSGGCVEVAAESRGLIRVRDSKNPKGPVLGFAPAEWDAFVSGVRKGELTVDKELAQTKQL